MNAEVPTEGTNAEVDEPMRRHQERDPDESGAETVEDSAAYERAVEDGSVRPAAGPEDPGAGELAPEFREPR